MYFIKILKDSNVYNEPVHFVAQNWTKVVFIAYDKIYPHSWANVDEYIQTILFVWKTLQHFQFEIPHLLLYYYSIGPVFVGLFYRYTTIP